MTRPVRTRRNYAVHYAIPPPPRPSPACNTRRPHDLLASASNLQQSRMATPLPPFFRSFGRRFRNSSHAVIIASTSDAAAHSARSAQTPRSPPAPAWHFPSPPGHTPQHGRRRSAAAVPMPRPAIPRSLRCSACRKAQHCRRAAFRAAAPGSFRPAGRPGRFIASVASASSAGTPLARASAENATLSRGKQGPP